ncbi:metallophosphoesterase [bacterium]|nr:metallophosphoesterase [bacterium]
MPAEEPSTLLVGILADTHGELDPRVFESFAGVDHIIHAGDIGSPGILLELEALAPVTAVLGNMDHPSPGLPRRDVERVELGGVRFLVTHKPMRAPTPALADVIVTGHTHRALVRDEYGVLYVNPGSTSEPRGPGGPTVALVNIRNQHAEVRILPLGSR